jgi:hypothetical protein
MRPVRHFPERGIVAQGMHGDALDDARVLGGGMDGAVELTGAEVSVGTQ